jgi:hypothetical protein
MEKAGALCSGLPVCARSIIVGGSGKRQITSSASFSSASFSSVDSLSLLNPPSSCDEGNPGQCVATVEWHLRARGGMHFRPEYVLSSSQPDRLLRGLVISTRAVRSLKRRHLDRSGEAAQWRDLLSHHQPASSTGASPQRANNVGDSTTRQRTCAEQKRGAGAVSVCPVNASGSFERFAASALSLSKLTTP